MAENADRSSRLRPVQAALWRGHSALTEARIGALGLNGQTLDFFLEM